jgi:hypothetical protein
LCLDNVGAQLSWCLGANLRLDFFKKLPSGYRHLLFSANPSCWNLIVTALSSHGVTLRHSNVDKSAAVLALESIHAASKKLADPKLVEKLFSLIIDQVGQIGQCRFTKNVFFAQPKLQSFLIGSKFRQKRQFSCEILFH